MRAIAAHVRANLIGYLALLVALSGTGYAAGERLLPPNSVGSAQVVDHSLRRVDFKQSDLPRGRSGARGPAGPAGPRGPTGPASLDGVAAGGDLTGTYPSPQLQFNAVLGQNIASNTITPYKLAPPMDWQPISDFTNGWHNAGSAYPTAAYFVDAGSIVHLRGVIAGGTVADSGAGTAFEIPCPLAPDDTLPHTFAVDAAGAFGEVKIVPNTTLPPNSPGCFGIHETPTGWAAFVRVTRGSNTTVSLDGVSWRATFQYPRAYGPCPNPHC